MMEQQYQNRLESKAMPLFFTTKNHMSQCTYFDNYITGSSLKVSYIGILSGTLNVLCIETKIHIL